MVFSRLKRGDMSLEDQPRSGRPSTCGTDEDIQKKYRDLMMFDRRRTIDELEALTGVSWSDCVTLWEENAPNCGRSGEWLLHHDNAPAHTALSVRQFLTKNGMKKALHPYSPDLAPCDFFLFPRMKRDLKGKSFQNVVEVRERTTEALKAITLQELQNCFEQWKKRLNNCIDSQGEYVEGDYILKMPREIYDFLKKNSRYFWVPPSYVLLQNYV